MYNRIVVPLDGSDLTMQALPYARLIAKSTGARITLLEVLEPAEQPAVAAAVGAEVVTAALDEARIMSPNHWAALRSGLASGARSRLQAAATPLRDEGIEVDVDVLEAMPRT